jgi:hypothetical protein
MNRDYEKLSKRRLKISDKKIELQHTRKLRGLKKSKGALTSATERQFATITTKDGSKIKLHPAHFISPAGVINNLGNPISGVYANFRKVSNSG